jgi:hypothetical protein
MLNTRHGLHPFISDILFFRNPLIIASDALGGYAPAAAALPNWDYAIVPAQKTCFVFSSNTVES